MILNTQHYKKKKKAREIFTGIIGENRANAVVLQNAPDNAIAVGVPARIIFKS